jgi:sugar phosphate isomerase/epimerase
MKIAVQLFTLRDSLEKDLWGTLVRLSDEGFKNLELAGLYNREAREWRDRLDELGMQVIAAHVGLDEASDMDKSAALAETLGFTRMVVPWVGKEAYASGWTPFGKRLEELGRQYVDRDLELLYHNHDFELTMQGGDLGLNLLFKAAHSTFLQAELDLYWLQKGGVDPGPYVLSMAGRVPLAHFKDMDENGEFTEVGDGVLDWDDIFESCGVAGTEYAIIENDQPKGDPIESVLRSRQFLKSQGLQD